MTEIMPRNEVHLSKSLSRILRHEAHKLGLSMKPDGYIYVDEVLTSPRCWLAKEAYTEDDVIKMAARNEKQRFTIRRDETGRLEIRANQGHSFEVEQLELRLITDPAEFSDVVHGTSWQSWAHIRNEGLKVMGRTHVHFAPGLIGQDGVISGMRRSCDVLIYLDLAAAMNNGLLFYVSSNRVVLTRGDVAGVVLPRYFKKVVDRRKWSEIH